MHSKVKPMRNFQLDKMMGFWYVVQYYSSTEETSEYKCMLGELQITSAREVSSFEAHDFTITNSRLIMSTPFVLCRNYAAQSEWLANAIVWFH